MFNAKNGILKIAGDTMDYIAFGNGDKELILLPGLGDGLKTVKGMALVFSIMYLKLAREYKVYVFSRRNNIPSGYSSRDMAKDTSAAMDALDIKKAHIIGISQGGTIAQYLAIDDPKRVDKLVLAVTYARSNKNIDAVLSKWITYANANDYARLFIDTAEKSYSEKYLKKNRKLYGIMTKIGVPKSFERFIVQANACMNHDSYDMLHKIKSPTLIIGGGQDRIVTAQAAPDMAKMIENASLFIYDELGHGLYEEATDFWDRVIDFLKKAAS